MAVLRLLGECHALGLGHQRPDGFGVLGAEHRWGWVCEEERQVRLAGGADRCAKWNFE